MDKLSLILISVNYGDFLSITLPLNKDYFDEVIVVTDLKDEETVQICAQNNVKCLRTDGFYENGAIFNKGYGINRAIESLENRKFLCSLDADVLLPEGFREKFEAINPNPEFYYGCKRYEIRTYEEYLKVRDNPELLKNYFIFRGVGFGFLQIFHYESTTSQFLIRKYGKPYPETKSNCELDWVHRNFWGDMIFDPPLQGNCPHPFLIENNPHSVTIHNDRTTGKLRELPFSVWHLGYTGQNTNRRTTPRFLDF